MLFLLFLLLLLLSSSSSSSWLDGGGGARGAAIAEVVGVVGRRWLSVVLLLFGSERLTALPCKAANYCELLTTNFH